MMARDLIETLTGAGAWELARGAIEEQLDKEPDDHWLWSRLSGVKYEQRDYRGALEAAEKALEIVPDCPLALWSYAGALDMLGRPAEAGKIYTQLMRRGMEELKTPDEDAEECWEGREWTISLILDCIFRSAGCLAKMAKRGKNARRHREMAVELYRHFLNLLDYGLQGIYSREEAVERLKKLVPGEKAIPAAMERARRELEEVMG